MWWYARFVVPDARFIYNALIRQVSPDEASWEENDISHERWCNDLAAKFLCVFVLDRFGDFVSDQVGFTPMSLYLR
jgi:hypothetical protein